MSTNNFIQTIMINNLNKRVSALATSVADIIVGGAPVISGDIQMNNNSITEIDQLVFNSGHALEDIDGGLNFNNAALITADALTPYQKKIADSELDMNNNDIINVSGIKLMDTSDTGTKMLSLSNGGLITENNDDIRTYLYTNETIGQPVNLDCNKYPLENVSSVNFADNAVLVSSDNTIYYNNNELATYTLSNDVNGVNQFALRQIANLTLTSGGGVLFGGVQNKLVPNADDDTTLLYQNVPIITANNISDYFPQAEWIGVATSSLNMQNYNITNANSITAGAMNANSINFNNNTAQKLTVLGGDLQYQGATVITTSDLASYLPAQTFQPTANQDLNMNNYSIRDASVGEFNAINLAGNTNYHLSATADGLQYQGSTVITESNFLANMPTTGIFNDINFGNNPACNLTGLTVGLYYNNKILATEEFVNDYNIYITSVQCGQNSFYDLGGLGFNSTSDLQFTMNNNGDALWNGATILTSANTNIPLANQVYIVSDAANIIMPNIYIASNTVSYFKGTIVGSTFAAEFSALANNIGGEDPRWETETQSTNIIYNKYSYLATINFEATNAGVYFAVMFNTTISDKVVVKIDQISNA